MTDVNAISLRLIARFSAARINSRLIIVDVGSYAPKEDQSFHTPGRSSSHRARLRYRTQEHSRRVESSIYKMLSQNLPELSRVFISETSRKQIEVIKIHRERYRVTLEVENTIVLNSDVCLQRYVCI